MSCGLVSAGKFCDSEREKVREDGGLLIEYTGG